MTGETEKPRRGIFRWLNANTVGIAMVGIAMIVSMARVLSIRKELFDPSQKIIRISHWQLELGYREALQSVIDAYEKLHPGVQVRQMPITEKIYGQWLNTHLIAGTAPDLAELGFAKLTSDTQYLARFYLPLTDLIDEPNPYNAGTDIADLPWRETFIDGMRGGYRRELQDYFSVPTSMHTVRVFYNKDLLRQITGSDQPPASMGELFEICRQVRQFAADRGLGNRLVPIAASRYNAPIFYGRYAVTFTAGLEPMLDADLDGSIASYETYMAFMDGKIGFDHPNVKAYYECVHKLCRQFNEGFMAMGRDDASFMFIQKNAVMLSTGSWDATSLHEQAEFAVGVFNFPVPATNEQWGSYVAGQQNEAATVAGGTFGVYKLARLKDQAIDFLRFLSSQKYNGLFTEGAGWLPATIGAQLLPRMEPFMPDPRGFTSRVSMGYGVHAGGVLSGQEWKYFSGEIGYDELASTVERALRDPRVGGDKAWAQEYDDMRRWCRNQDRILAVQSMRMLMDPDAADAPPKYRRALLQQLLYNNGGEIRHRFQTVRQKPIDLLVD